VAGLEEVWNERTIGRHGVSSGTAGGGMTPRIRQRDRDAAERALDQWGAWRNFKGSIDLRDAVAHAIEAERERIAKFLDRLSYYDQAYTVRNQDGT
jgi:hypothetical protein